MWPLIKEGWTELCEWTVFLVRVQLAHQPDLAFTESPSSCSTPTGHGEGASALHCETSPHDDDWATKFAVPSKGPETPLDVLLPAHSGNDAVHAQAFWERLRTEAPTRRLGRANALVACSLLLLASDAPLSLEGESAAAVELQATGWVAWVDRCLPGEGRLLAPPRLPFDGEALPPLRPWPEALSAGLTERAEAAAQLRALSQ